MIKKAYDKAKAAAANPELDQLKAALKDLKGRTTKELLAGKMPTLDKELKEIETLSAEQRQLLKEMFLHDAIIKSPEAANLAAFVDEFAEYTGLQKAIDEAKKKKSADPVYRIMQLARASTPLLATLGTSFMEWLTGEKEEDEEKGKKPSKLDKAAAKADAVVKKNRKKKKRKKEKGTKETRETKMAGKKKARGAVEVSTTRSTRRKPTGKPGRVEHLTVKNSPLVDYNLPQKYMKVPKSEEEFHKTLAEIGSNRHWMNAYFTFLYAAEYTPPGFDKTHWVKVEAKDDEGNPIVLEYKVDNGVFLGKKKGEATKVSVAGGPAQVIAQLKGRELLLPGMEKHVYQQAKRDGGVLKFRSGQDLANAIGYKGDFGKVLVRPEGILARKELEADESKRLGIDPTKMVVAGGSKELVQSTMSSRIVDMRGGFTPGGQPIQDKTDFHSDADASYNEATCDSRTFDPTSFRLNGKPISYEKLKKNPELLAKVGLGEKPVGKYVVRDDLEKVAEAGKAAAKKPKKAA